MGRGGATLRLDAGMALERDVTLPLAARDNLVDVLRMDMDRLSPFAAADVYWSHRIVAEDVIRGRLVVRLSMVPRRAIAHAIQVLTQLGLRPVAIAAPMADGTWHHIGVDAPAEAHRPYRRRALGFACVLWALLGIAAAITPFLRQELRLREVEAQIARLRPSVSEAEALRREIATARAGEDALAQVRTGTASPLAVIAALTSALPDDSFLTALSSRGGTIELQGQSRNAARLIGLLSEEPGIRGVAFAAPVTRIDGEARELFTIRATVTP
jgi:general secretion pathway protein L